VEDMAAEGYARLKHDRKYSAGASMEQMRVCVAGRA
jgi:hypothetical protein